ncbi:MAG: CGNR zinc finger domain-containing protein [Anaerolineae bacterium]|nr:CGNR zinc finger domain-containing protein [Anaerolineae bacterium]
MSEISPYPSNPDLIGEQPCLIFANTVGGSRQAAQHEYLHDYTDLLAWGRHAGLIAASEAQRLLAEAMRRPREAARVFERAIFLRETIYRIFSAIAAGGTPETADLGLLNEALAEVLAKLQVTPTETGFTWNWRSEPEALDGMLWPVVRSAGELLTSADLHRVRECAGDDCGWLFIDTSRNHSRRWCDMNDCGNRAKAKRHYARSRLARKTV